MHLKVLNESPFDQNVTRFTCRFSKTYPKANLRSSPSGGPLLPRVGLTDRGRSSSSPIVAFLVDLDNLS